MEKKLEKIQEEMKMQKEEINELQKNQILSVKSMKQ